jgi:hypothetical protein
MYLCILDHASDIVLHKEVPAEPAAFLEAIAPFRDGLVVACECLFCWYWLADLCGRRRSSMPNAFGTASPASRPKSSRSLP